MRFYGVSVADDDVRTLVDLLMRVGRADDLELAEKIESAQTRHVLILALGPHERDTLLGVLDDPPDGLVELRAALARDHRQRKR